MDECFKSAVRSLDIIQQRAAHDVVYCGRPQLQNESAESGPEVTDQELLVKGKMSLTENK